MNSLSSNSSQSWLSWFLRGLLILLFLILLAKLFEVQIIKGNYYRQLSEENRIRHVPIPAPRGQILAAGGEVLAGNVEVKRKIEFGGGGSFQITDDLTNATPDEIISDYKRFYPLGKAAAHAIGYLTTAGTSEVGKINPDCSDKGPILSGTLVGRTGLEEEYQCQLQGTPGEELIEVDSNGKRVRTLGVRPPIPGQDIKTSINYGLQQEVARDMESSEVGKKGAAIVIDTNGKILAFYSLPSFDPGNIAASITDSNLPLFDRAISGTFHPGSVFKPVVAIAALEEGSIDKNYEFNDPGIITVNGFSYTNWYFTEYGRTEGRIGLIKAIARSTDTFFYTIGAMVGPDNIAKWADIFGLNQPTGVDIPGEIQGLIPTPAWKLKTIKEAWFLGNTYNMAIGQGDVSVTPIELNTYISAIANKGVFCRPEFLINSSPVCHSTGVSQNNLNLVTTGMEGACSPGGTGYTFFDFAQKHNGQTVGCKTGTAEVGVIGLPNAWFTFFSPVEKPQIVATIVFEKGGQGADVAGPVARKIADFYFQGNTN